jgi:ribosomal protein L13
MHKQYGDYITIISFLKNKVTTKQKTKKLKYAKTGKG